MVSPITATTIVVVTAGSVTDAATRTGAAEAPTFPALVLAVTVTPKGGRQTPLAVDGVDQGMIGRANQVLVRQALDAVEGTVPTKLLDVIVATAGTIRIVVVVGEDAGHGQGTGTHLRHGVPLATPVGARNDFLEEFRDQ